MTEHTYTVSGTTHAAAIADSQVPLEEGWPTPTVRKSGRGRSYTYRMTLHSAHKLRSHLDDLELALSGSGDPEAFRDRSAIRRDIQRVDAQMQDHRHREATAQILDVMGWTHSQLEGQDSEVQTRFWDEVREREGVL